MPEPAEGERNALFGLVPQYSIAPFFVYKGLFDPEFVEIRLVDPMAGRVDDFQIISLHQVNAYQVKWSRFPESMTFQQLITKGGDEKGNTKPSLLSQLVEGRRKLKDIWNIKQVIVHLLSNNVPSTHDRVKYAPSPSIDANAGVLGPTKGLGIR